MFKLRYAVLVLAVVAFSSLAVVQPGESEAMPSPFHRCVDPC